MPRTLLFIALAFALLSLGLTVVARRRQTRAGRTSVPLDAFVLAPIAIVVGVVPGLFGATSSALGIGASVVSMILSVASMMLFARGFRKRA